MPPSDNRTTALSRLQEIISDLPQHIRLGLSSQLALLVQSQELSRAQIGLMEEIEVWMLTYLPDIMLLEETPAARSIEQLRAAEQQLESSFAQVGMAANNSEGTPEEQLDKLRQEVFALFEARHQHREADKQVCDIEGAYSSYVLRSRGALEQLGKIFAKYEVAGS